VAAVLIQSVMCSAVTLLVPVEADVKAGKTWAAMAKLKA
jgi:DNA polymerase I-like protein with 3'-5' exonuclease and polymerase domains